MCGFEFSKLDDSDASVSSEGLLSAESLGTKQKKTRRLGGPARLFQRSRFRHPFLDNHQFLRRPGASRWEILRAKTENPIGRI